MVSKSENVDESFEHGSHDSDPAWEATLECENCGGTQTHQLPAKVVVSEQSDRVYINDTRCDDWGCSDCKYTVECETCELKKHLTVKDRNPIEESDDD